MANFEESRLFDGVDPAELKLLRASAELREFPAGAYIFREGDPGDGIYFLDAGVVQISALVTQEERRTLSRLTEGDFFGEMGVLDGAPRSACAIAEQPTKTWFIARDRMLQLVERAPRLAVNFLREFSQRMRDFNRRYIQEVLQAERLTVVGRFARSIVHDFKNPLHVIGLAAEIGEMESIPAEMRKNATKRIRKQVERLNNMISELLEFTKSPQRDAVLSARNFGRYVSELLGELKPELQERGVTVVVRHEPPPIDLFLDTKRMVHVFTNLLSNAVEAVSGSGTIYIDFTLKDSEIVTEVEDSGKGIAPEIASNLFEPFATFGKAKGSGLGLSICKKIVEDHGGWIRARNQPGSGAVFSFGLPIRN